MHARAAGLAVLALAAVPALPSLAGAASALPTCRADRIEPSSYRLTTRAVAAAVTQERHDWWESFDLGKYEWDLYDLNQSVTRVAERALEVDPANLLAPQILARQYVVLGEPELAEEAWRTVFGAGGTVAWTGTLYDVDARTYFLLAFDARGMRVYRFDQVVGRVKRGFHSIPEFPSGEDERFWASSAGCVPPEIVPEAEVPWSSVREIKVCLHGQTGSLEVYKPVGEDHLAMRGRGPAGYQDLVRRTLVQFVDPQNRIALPPLKPGVGW